MAHVAAFALLCLVAPSAGSPLHPDKYERAFAKYVKEYNRSYTTQFEKLERFYAFRTRLQHIDEVNAEDVGFHLAPNEVADRFPGELSRDRWDRLVRGPGAGRAESFSRALRGVPAAPAPTPAAAEGQLVQLASPGSGFDDGLALVFQKEFEQEAEATDAEAAAKNPQQREVVSALDNDARRVVQVPGVGRTKALLRALHGADAFYRSLAAR